MCLIQFLLRNSSNSELTNPGPLSVTMVSGRPNLANSDLSTSITAAEDVEGVEAVSIHLECASITIRMFFPSNGPAKSK